METLRARSWWLLTVVVAVVALIAAGIPGAAAASSGSADHRLVGLVDQASSVVEVTVADRDELDELVATGTDLDHSVEATDDGIVVNAVVTADEAAALGEAGFDVGDVVYSAEEAELRIAEREATIAAHRQANADFAAATAAPATGDVKVIRADYYTSGSNQVLSVEAKWAQGQTANNQLVVERDSGPGTELGSGGTHNISRFVDAGVYLYHRGASLVTTRPERIRVTSPTGDSHVVDVNDWLPFDEDDPEPPGYQKDFITSYLTPTELYDRIHQLAAEFPDLATIVELPHKTNGYRRKAQALLDPPPPRIVIEGPSPAAGEYAAAPASFGPSAPSAGIPGDVALGDDATDQPNDGCEPLVGFPAGAIALVDRGNCNYTVKTLNAQAAGAVALVIANNTGGLPSPGGNAPGITIPTVQISQDDGAIVKAGLPAAGRFFSESVSSNRRVGVDSLAWGHEGGNDIFVEVVDPGASGQPLASARSAA